MSRSHPVHIRLVPIHARSQEFFCCPSQSLTKEEKIPWVTRDHAWVPTHMGLTTNFWTSIVKKRRRVLALFISIFLRNRSLSDARWFYGKKRKIGNGNLYLTENRLSWIKMCCASDNHNYMCHTCAKEFLNLSFN